MSLRTNFLFALSLAIGSWLDIQPGRAEESRPADCNCGLVVQTVSLNNTERAFRVRVRRNTTGRIYVGDLGGPKVYVDVRNGKPIDVVLIDANGRPVKPSGAARISLPCASKPFNFLKIKVTIKICVELF